MIVTFLFKRVTGEVPVNHCNKAIWRLPAASFYFDWDEMKCKIVKKKKKLA